jgi:hypothetical protein
LKKVIFAVLFACAGFAQAQNEPSYEVHRVTNPIVIDGVVNAEEWKAASPVEFIFPWDSQTGAKQKTRARLMWDSTNLYVSYECEDADITAQVKNRDDNVYRDDTVEIFLNVAPTQIVAYYGIEMNVNCVYMDYLWTSKEFYHKTIQFEGVQIASKINGTLNERNDKDTGWSLEVAIPWSNFSAMARRAPQAGTVYKANMSRWDGTEPARRLSMWLDSKLDRPHPHAPEQFGDLKFVQ